MNEHFPFVNAPLPYKYDALEPYITTQTLYLHHDRIQQKNVQMLNEIINDYPWLQNKSLEELLSDPDSLPEEIRQSILDYGGGVYSHIIYFNGMTNSMTRFQADALYPAILRDFGNVENLFSEFKKAALSVFGSGNAWLTVDQDGRLMIVTAPDQDTPLSQNLCPIAVIDVWEHAYYLKNYNDRSAYIEDWFHVVSWEMADELYKKCLQAET